MDGNSTAPGPATNSRFTQDDDDDGVFCGDEETGTEGRPTSAAATAMSSSFLDERSPYNLQNVRTALNQLQTEIEEKLPTSSLRHKDGASVRNALSQLQAEIEEKLPTSSACTKNDASRGTNTGVNLSFPGAYSEGGTKEPTQGEADEIPDIERHELPASQSTNLPAGAGPGAPIMATRSQDNNDSDQANSGQTNTDAVAVPVTEDERDLPTAEPVDQTRGQRASTLRRQKTRRHAAVAFFFGLLFIGITVLLLLLRTKDDDRKEHNNGKITAPQTLSSGTDFTQSPTESRLELEILQFFPSYTRESLEDPDSAQSQALSWLLNDPFLLHYKDQEWRVRQRFALVTLYYATNGHNWTNHDNWLNYSHHECSWWAPPSFAFPVQWFQTFTSQYENPCEQPTLTANDRDSDSDSDNSSFITMESSERQVYKNLWLWRNNLDTSNGNYLPEELYWLSSLQSLSLFGSNFSAAIISTSIGQLSHLQAVAFSFSSLGGSIPTEIGLLTNLSFLGLGKNQLTGTVPTEVGLLSNLESLLMYENQLSGSLHDEVFSSSMQDLTFLDLDTNMLSGPLPTTMGFISSLQQVIMYGNYFSGPVPSELGSLSSAIRLVLSHNNFNQTIPTELGQMPSLMSLELQGNQLSGSLPSLFVTGTGTSTSTSSLTHLLLQDNQLTEVPPELFTGETTSALAVFNASGNPLLQISEANMETTCFVSFDYNETECKEKLDRLEFPVACGCDCAC